MLSRRLSVALAVAVVGSGLVVVQAAEPPSQPMIGQPAPDFDLPSLDGEQISLAGLRGKFVVAHFGTDW